jgi:hypothetical protein
MVGLPQVRVTLVKDGKIDVTQLSKEDEEAEEAAKGGVGTMSRATADAGNLFQFALARAGISGATFETDVSQTLFIYVTWDAVSTVTMPLAKHLGSCNFSIPSSMRAVNISR